MRATRTVARGSTPTSRTPIDQGGRDDIQRQVLAAYRAELERSRKADYVSDSFEGLDYDDLAAATR